jgi:hypothetical protein
MKKEDAGDERKKVGERTVSSVIHRKSAKSDNARK